MAREDDKKSTGNLTFSIAIQFYAEIRLIFTVLNGEIVSDVPYFATTTDNFCTESALFEQVTVVGDF